MFKSVCISCDKSVNFPLILIISNPSLAFITTLYSPDVISAGMVPSNIISLLFLFSTIVNGSSLSSMNLDSYNVTLFNIKNTPISKFQ